MSTTQLQETSIDQKPMSLPAPRGPLSERVIDALRTGNTVGLPALARALPTNASCVDDDDIQLALFCLYELHYGGFESVSDSLEWAADLLSVRAALEQAFERELRAIVETPALPEPSAEHVAEALFALTAGDTGPSVARFVARSATLEQAREFLMHRSIYTLKEADPHTWAIPRLSGRAKAALVEIQSDEYGGGRPGRMHAAIFANTMRAAGLDPTYGAYIDAVPAITIASLNMMSMFGLHRRLRGAIVGHLAAFEMTSSIPNRFYGNGFRRLGFGAQATWYFDEHVEADAVHEQIAARDLAGGLVETDRTMLAEVMFGAAACLAMDARAGAALLGAWTADASAVRTGEEPPRGE